MDNFEIRNAKIKSVTLGVEDHGIITIYLNLDYGDSGQSFGGYDLRDSKYLSAWIQGILKIVGVDSWDQLVGKYIKVESSFSKVKRIGNLLKDEWFDPSLLKL